MTADEPIVDAADSAPPGETHYLNRELSWLRFNDRVAELVSDARIPLLERVKFVAIWVRNLDEFFQVRVAGLKDQVAAGLQLASPDGMSASKQLLAIRDSVAASLHRLDRVFLDELMPALADAGVRFVSWDDLDVDDRKNLAEVFETRIFPVLTPLAVDPGHPFPYISDLSLNLAVIVDDPSTGERRFARVKVPSILERFVVLPDGERYVPLEQIISAHLDALFPGMEIVEHYAFRVTRNADLTLEEEEADDLLAMVEMELRRRRFGRAVRLGIQSSTSDEVRDLLARELDLDDDDVFVHEAPLDLSGLMFIADLDRPDLRDRPWGGITEPELSGTEGEPVDFFPVLRRRDVLLHHPYTSYSRSVEEFIRQAAADPSVLAIKLALYRTSGDSPIVKSLIRAAEVGKQVAVLVELKARFDEERNIEWAKALENVGVHVTYGLVGLKIHTKTCLVVRDEPDGIRRYCHIGTGNYNPNTARRYEDLGLLTSDPDVGADLTQLFNFLTGYGREVEYRRLLVAPHPLRDRITELLRNEAAHAGRAVLKLNALTDATMIDELYAASRAGVSIDLVVRGICCLRPGVPGMSENIRVRSIVGRYLEHSRIYHFANGEGAGVPAYYIGSADLMPRNLDRRVEALVPVRDPALQARLAEVLEINLTDDTSAWTLAGDGTWSRARGERRGDTHTRLQDAATARAAG